MSTDSTTARLWLALGALNGFLTVALGAFAAHGLKGRIGDAQLLTFAKGVEYQGLHALALLVTGTLLLLRPDLRAPKIAAALFLIGIALFSGSLYLLALTGTRAWGAITPVGGTAFLLGWAILGIGFWRLR